MRSSQAILVAAFVLFIFGSNTFAQDQTSNRVNIEYIAHAAFVITSSSGDRVLIDPYGSRVWIGYDYPTGIETDAVLITHPHYDHDGGVSRGHDAPWSEGTRVLREPGSYAVGDIGIQGVAGKHADPYGKEFGQTNTIWVLEIDGLRIAHIGDNGPVFDEAAAEIGNVDILMMPIDSEYHILKEYEIQRILEQLNPKVLVPMHYRFADLEPVAGKPEDLGGIDDWLEGRANIRKLATSNVGISIDELPVEMQIHVFRHSPLVQPPH
jgi:L-ascorbate metabolism protein UlaG (beta-lactamase superfamily)